MNNEDVLNIISSSLFANICTLLSAVGTISAVIVSLYLSRKNEKIKYKIIRNFIIPIGFVGDFLGNYYSLSLINLSKYLSITIESNPYIQTSKGNLTLIKNIDWENKNQLPKVINYGEKYTITIDKSTAKEILQNVKNKKIKFIFKDIFGKVYIHKINRKELEQFILIK